MKKWVAMLSSRMKHLKTGAVYVCMHVCMYVCMNDLSICT